MQWWQCTLSWLKKFTSYTSRWWFFFYTEVPLLLEFESHSQHDQCKPLQILQNHHTKIKKKCPGQLSDYMASCCWTVPIPMWPTDFWTEYCVKGGAPASCIQPGLMAMQFSHLWTIKESPQRSHIYIRWCTGGWRIVV